MRVLVMMSLLAAGPAWAQVQVQITPPSITFAAPPPLVVVQPGVQVVPDYDEEVFFVDGYYWVRRGPHWYRSADHRGGWVVAGAPGVLVKMPKGKFKHHKAKGVVVAAPVGAPVAVVEVRPGKGKGKKHKH